LTILPLLSFLFPLSHLTDVWDPRVSCFFNLPPSLSSHAPSLSRPSQVKTGVAAVDARREQPRSRGGAPPSNLVVGPHCRALSAANPRTSSPRRRTSSPCSSCRHPSNLVSRPCPRSAGPHHRARRAAAPLTSSPDLVPAPPNLIPVLVVAWEDGKGGALGKGTGSPPYHCGRLQPARRPRPATSPVVNACRRGPPCLHRRDRPCTPMR
jgi:hypothetical protein